MVDGYIKIEVMKTNVEKLVETYFGVETRGEKTYDTKPYRIYGRDIYYEYPNITRSLVIWQDTDGKYYMPKYLPTKNILRVIRKVCITHNIDVWKNYNISEWKNINTNKK